MPGFARPELLLALLALPLVSAFWLRTRRAAVVFPSLELFDGLRAGRATGATHGPVALRVCALALVLIAAAGPRLPDYATPIPAPGLAIVIAVDVSGSMAERDFPDGDRLDSRQFAAVGAVSDFIDRRPDDRIGLVAFAELPRTVAPPTLSHGALTASLTALRPATGPAAGTSIGDALAESLDRLEATGGGRKVIVLVSDGEENGGGRAAAIPPLCAARLAEALGVPVYAVDCSPPGNTEGPELLARVSKLSGGQSFRATDAEAVRAALSAIDRLERAEAPPPRYRRHRDLTGEVAAMAMLMLAVGMILGRTRWAIRP